MKREIEEIAVSDLIPYVNNSRTHSEEQVNQIAASIREFGFTNPILIDEESSIIAGHGRVMAAKKLKFDNVPCIRLSHLTETQKKAYVIADNKLALNAGWNDELLSLELSSLKDADFDLSLIGFDDSELDGLIGLDINEGLTDEDSVPDLPDEPITQLGDIYILGNHRLMCGDSTDAATVEILMDGQKAELLFTSPPYSDMRDYNGDKDLSINNLVKFIEVFYKHVEYQVINLGIQRKDNEVYEYWQQYINEAKNTGYKFLSWNIWDRDNAGSISHATSMFMTVHEWLFVFGKEVKRLNRTIENDMDKYKAKYGEEVLKTGAISGTRQKDGSVKKNKTKTYTHHQLESIIKQTPELGKIREKHPATFPVDLPLQHIEAMTNSKDAVIDCFGGSGSTLIACEKTNRKCFMMELDPHYCDVIVQRWEDYTGNKAERVTDFQEAANG